MDEDKLKELLIRENEEFKKLFDKHQSYERKLENFKSKTFLTEEERVEERELKKLKLALKDKMYLMMEEYRRSL